MDFLIKAYWYQADAAKLHVKVTDAEVQKAFATAKQQTFPTPPASAPSSVRPVRRTRTSCSASRSTDLSRTRGEAHQADHPGRHPPTTTITPRVSGPRRRRNMRIVLTKTAGAGATRPRRRSSRARAGTRWPRSTRPTRRPRTTAGCSTASPRASRTRRSPTAAFSAPINKLHGPGQGAVRLLRRRGHQDHAGHAAVARAGHADDQAAADQPVADTPRPRSTTTPRRTGSARPRAARAYAMADCKGYKAPKTATTSRARLDHRVSAAGAPGPAGEALGAPGRDHAPAASGVPLGPRAGRALDRPPHGRGVLRARRRRPAGRRRQDGRRARRRAVPGPLPVAAARGARRRRPGAGGQRTSPRS